MTITDKQSELKALAETHTKTLEALIESSIVESDKAYKTAGETAKQKEKKESALAALGVALGLLLQRSRVTSNEMATMHANAELKAIIGKGIERVSLPFGPTPKPGEMDKYISNALDLARKSETIESTGHRGSLIVTTEIESQYSKGRQSGFDHLRTIPDSEAEKAGFKVAKTQDEIEGANKQQTEGAVSLITKQWYHLHANEPACCPKCISLYGLQIPLEESFPYGDPPLHPVCHCNVYFNTAGYAPARRAMDPMTLPMSTKKEPLLTRIEVAIDERAVFDMESRTITGAIASDETLDAHGSIIRADGWNLARYHKNPVLLWAHKASGYKSPEPQDVLGTTTARVVDKHLAADLHFSPKGMNPKADLVFEQMQAKIIRGISVGFSPRSYHFEKDAQGEEIIVIDKQDLVEVSIVPVPSNENTLAKQIRGYLQECGCCESEREAALEPPQEKETMSTSPAMENVLPAAIAALLKVDSVNDAVREISKRDLELGIALKAKEEAEKRAVSAEKTLQDRTVQEADAWVDALINSGDLDESRRESAQALSRLDPCTFRKLHPLREAHPQAKTLKSRIVNAEDATATQSDIDADPIMPRVRELRNQGVPYSEAFSKATREYESKKRA